MTPTNASAGPYDFAEADELGNIGSDGEISSEIR